MQVTIIEEAGYNTALYGFSLSYKDRATPRVRWWTHDRALGVANTAIANAGIGKGHDKFLRQVMVWVDVEAPRYWWSEFDTYKVGVVAQSESTMHTIMKRPLDTDDFERLMSDTMLKEVNLRMAEAKEENDIGWAKAYLPESYLQRRVVSLNYAVLRCIIDQRANHKLPEWSTFIAAIYAQCEHPELLPKNE